MGFGSHCSDNNPDVIEVQTRKHLSGEARREKRAVVVPLAIVVGKHMYVDQQVGHRVLAAGEPQYSTIIKGTTIEYTSDGHGCTTCSCAIYVSCALPFQMPVVLTPIW